jgi:hypothetical protein
MTNGNGNRSWAFNEAVRRARVMAGAYSIYQRGDSDDYILMTVEAKPPVSPWRRVATIEPDGSYSFRAST